MHIFGEIPFVKPQKDTSTTDTRLKTMNNERKRLILQAQNKLQKLNQNKINKTSIFLSFFIVFNRLSVV